MKDLERIISYLDNEMTGNDILLLENDLRENVSLQQMLNLVKEINSTVADTEYISFSDKLHNIHHDFVSNDANSFAADEKTVNPPSPSKFRIGWNLATIAASFILIIAIVAIFKISSTPSSETLFTQYYTKYEANIDTRSENTDNTNLINAIKLYDRGSYTAAIQKFLTIIKQDKNNTAARFFLGVSYLETQNIPKAIESLNFVILQNDTAFVEHAEWYLALCYVKNGQKKQAVSLLTKISAGQNFYKILALDVLKKLK